MAPIVESKILELLSHYTHSQIRVNINPQSSFLTHIVRAYNACLRGVHK
ncbi:hypothetical protein F4X33_01180 [Candidatus Poribacteria bacterium]|nr:hypothetical protein [Candidatus Poribacteria bacterium]